MVMGDKTNIAWTDYTWSPWEGCTKVSTGCAKCYAGAINHRFGKDNWGKGHPRRLTVDWKKPRRWNDRAAERMEIGSLNRCPKVFPSMCDPFDPEVPAEWLARFLVLIEQTPCLKWLLLTKRPELWRERLKLVSTTSKEHGCLADDWLDGDFPDNVWIGASVENQEMADVRIPALLEIPAKLHFVSYEPALGPVSFVGPFQARQKYPLVRRLRWIIPGGESGHGARRCYLMWLSNVVSECQEFGVPVFVKQCGDNFHSATGKVNFKSPKGGDPSEWPEYLRVRQFPCNT